MGRDAIVNSLIIAHMSGRHFLQTPGPTNVPDRVLHAIGQPTIDHRSPAFVALTREVLDGLKGVFGTKGPVVIFPSAGTGAWEAALVNTLSPGDKVLAVETGEFARLWAEVATRLGIEAEVVAGDWTRGVDPAAVQQVLEHDHDRRIRAVLVVHNETSTGVTSRIDLVRKAMSAARHDALLFIDTVSSLASIDVRHDEWGVDVTLSSSQKGLMLPPGLSFQAISDKALAAARTARLPKSYWSWEPMFAANASGFFPYTPATNLLFGLREALRMLNEEGLPQVFARHRRLAEATRAAAGAWALENVCRNPEEYSPIVTALAMPEGHDSEAFRTLVRERFSVTLGAGLGRLKGRVFRIGHLGDFNEPMLMAALSAVEMGLAVAGIPHAPGGVNAAMASLISSSSAES
jgi:alanine-glyoxylate transaminase/serine-glyoxylate transaminase/serine-pyruvate transaminase